MVNREYSAARREVRTLFNLGTVGELTDGQLLERFTEDHGEVAELAFAALVERHGSMILRVCRAVLHNEQDARDAFQAAFLILVRKAGTLQVRDSLGPWLHQVALRVASCARSAAARRQRHEQRAAEIAASRRVEDREHDDLMTILHEEIDRLPEHLRAPVVLCLLEGLTRYQAARRLGWPIGTVQSRLARGRERLRRRLTHRGVAPTAALAIAVPSGEAAVVQVPGEWMNPIVRAATQFASRNAAAAEMVSAGVLVLVEGALKTMLVTKLKMAGIALMVLSLAATGAGVWANQKPGSGDENPGRAITVPPAKRESARIPEVVARVNGKPITREELAERCLARYGAKELERLIAWTLMQSASERRGLTISDDEVEAEAGRTAKGFGLSAEAWFRTLKEERGISKDQYLHEILYPGLLLKKLGLESESAFREFKRTADIKVYLDPPADRREENPHQPARSQEARLKDVERKLDEVLKTLDALKRH